MEFQFQDPGEGIDEAEILEVLVSAGDEVTEGQDVIVIETDKAAFELASPRTGTVEEVVVKEGDVVHVGDPLIRFSDDTQQDEKTEAREKGGKGEKRQARDEGEKDEKRQAREKGGKDEKRQARDEGEKDEKRQARDEGEKDEKRQARDEGEKDEKRQARDEGEKDEKRQGRDESDEASEEAEAADRPRRPVPATPATRRLARELGVDLRSVSSSGEDGRVTAEDVRRAAEGAEGEPERERPARGKDGAVSARRKGVSPDGGLPDFSAWGEVERTPLRSIRRKIAKHMTLSWERIPHVTHHDLLDVTGLERLRQRIAPRIEDKGAKLTLTPLLIKAVIGLLKDYPRMNASFDAEREELVIKRYYNIGLATDTDRGLIVPVVHGADALSLLELTRTMQDLAERTRQGKASRDDLVGGTFTITNVGSIGGRTFTPIINYPEVAILGIGRARLENVVEGTLEEHATRVRYVLPVSLAFDHRVLDGAESARFVADLQHLVSDADGFVAAL